MAQRTSPGDVVTAEEIEWALRNIPFPSENGRWSLPEVPKKVVSPSEVWLKGEDICKVEDVRTLAPGEDPIKTEEPETVEIFSTAPQLPQAISNIILQKKQPKTVGIVKSGSQLHNSILQNAVFVTVSNLDPSSSQPAQCKLLRLKPMVKRRKQEHQPKADEHP